MLSVALSQTLFSYGKRPRLGVYFPNFSQTPFPGGTRGFAVLTFFSSSCSFFLQFLRSDGVPTVEFYDWLCRQWYLVDIVATQ